LNRYYQASFKYELRLLRCNEVAGLEETLCSIEIVKDGNGFKAKVQTSLGRYVEYHNEDFENLLQQVYEDIQEEIETTI